MHDARPQSTTNKCSVCMETIKHGWIIYAANDSVARDKNDTATIR